MRSSGATSHCETFVTLLARDQKLEGQVVALLQYIKPWMQKLVTESKERLNKRMEATMDKE